MIFTVKTPRSKKYPSKQSLLLMTFFSAALLALPAQHKFFKNVIP